MTTMFYAYNFLEYVLPPDASENIAVGNQVFIVSS